MNDASKENLHANGKEVNEITTVTKLVELTGASNINCLTKQGKRICKKTFKLRNNLT